MSVRAQSWYRRNTYAHEAFSVERLAAQREATVSICLPARDEERTIGPILEQLPFVAGYGVDIALLLDAYRLAGLDALAQVDLEVRQNAHKPLRDLGPMAYAVLQAVAVRLEREGRLRATEPQPVERPPLATLRAAA